VKKTKILHIQLLPLLSGVQNMMLSLLDGLDKEKYEIYVMSKPGGPLVKKVKDLGYNYIPVGSLRRNLSPLDIVSFFHIYFICRKYRFDIVHTHSSKTGFLGRIAARFAWTPRIIHTVHGFPFHAYQPKLARYFYLLLEMMASRFCDYIPVVNRHECEWAKASGLFPSKKLLTIYNAVHPQEIYTPRKYTAGGEVGIKKSLPFLEGYFTIGFVGRFTRAKNIVTIVKTAIAVCRQNPRIKFILIGDGELWDECKDLVTSADLTQQILLPGWQNNVDYWLTNMDVFLLYSHWEGLSISMLEAMSMGIPVVASDIKGNNELVDDSNGVLVPVVNATKLKEVLIGLPDKKDDLERWSGGSLSKSRELFGLERFISEYENLYQGNVTKI
jgi:glycosyltransferase involved in cell wall biosynthesis